MSQHNKDVVLSYVDAINRGDLESLCNLFAPDAVIWGVKGWGSVDQVRPIWHALMTALRINLTVHDMIAEGDRVAVRYTERGISVREFFGSGPTGQTYEVLAMQWFVLRDGLIHRHWGTRDSATQRRQLGFAHE